MTRLLLHFLLLVPAIAFAQAVPEDFDDVMVPLNLYLQAHATGNGELIHRAFHPEARVFSVDGDTLAQLSVEEFAALFSGAPAPDESQRHRRIVNLDITGNVASAKIELDYPDVFFTDYMSLLRVGNEWKIINKSFRREAPRRP